MANLDFYAAHDDLVKVLNFLIHQTDVRAFESYSPYGEELAEFSSVQDLEARYPLDPLGISRYGNGSAITLQLWSPSVMADVEIKRIELRPESCKGHTFRYSIKGWGLIQLYLGGLYEKTIVYSHLGHNSEKRAQSWDKEEGVNWGNLAKLSSKIQYHIRHRLAAAKIPRHPILPQALELIKQGYLLKEYNGDVWRQYMIEKPSSQSSKKVLLQETDAAQRPVVDAPVEAPGHLAFQTSEELDAYIQE